MVIKPRDEGVSFRKVNVFWPTKYLGSICGTGLLDIETPANGSLIVKTKTRAQTKALLKCTNFCEKAVTVSLHFARNTTKGTIFAPEMRSMSEEEILDGLRPEGVCHVRRLTTFRDGQKRDTSLLVLTFNTTKLPDTLLAGHIRYSVRVFIPNPLRCYNCQRFGHGSKFCKQSARCQKCGAAPHDGSPCSAPIKCLNCDATDHTTNSTQCPTWKKEKEICSIKATDGISYPQARRKVEERTSTPSGKTYAQIAQKQTTTTTISTQTDDIPQLPPLKLLTTTKSTRTEASTSTEPSPSLEPPVTRRASSRSRNDRTGPQAAATPGPSRRHMSPDRAAQPPKTGSHQTHPQTETGHDTEQERHSRPAICIARGRQRSISSKRLPPPGGPPPKIQ